MISLVNQLEEIGQAVPEATQKRNLLRGLTDASAATAQVTRINGLNVRKVVAVLVIQ